MYTNKLHRIYAETDGICINEYEALAALAENDSEARKTIRSLITEWEAAAKTHNTRKMKAVVKKLVDLVPEQADDDEEEPLCRYTVNVHYDAVATVVVEARSEEEALELAEDEAASLDASDFDFDLTDSCVTDVEDI